jgi:drug/metabolite transporter (DMT)-like permease
VKSWVPVTVLLSASTLWGLTWLPLKHFGAHGVEGPLVTLVAHGSVGVLALPLLWRSRRLWLPWWREMALLTFLGGLANICFASAMLLGDVTRVMVLFYLLPAWGVLGGRWLLGESIDRFRGLSLLCALLGAFLILGGPKIFASPPGFIDLVAIISGLTLALNNVIFRKLQQVPVGSKIAANFVGCLLWAFFITLLSAAPIPTVPLLLWFEVMGFGLVWILLATVGTLWGVHHMEAGRSSVLIIMELTTAVTSAAIITRRAPLPVECVGAAFIVACALLEARRPAPEMPTSAG